MKDQNEIVTIFLSRKRNKIVFRKEEGKEIKMKDWSKISFATTSLLFLCLLILVL